MLVGRFDTKVDSKNRFMLPARLRADLSNPVFITKSPESKLLVIYNQDEYEKKMNSIMDDANLESPKKALLLRYLSSNTKELNFDISGRLVIPPQLISHLDLSNNDIMLLGMQNKIEIWNPKEYEAREAEQLQEMLDGDYGILL